MCARARACVRENVVPPTSGNAFVPYLIQSPLPAVLSLHHQVNAVRERGQDPRCSGFKRDRLAFKINSVEALSAQRLEHYGDKSNDNDYCIRDMDVKKKKKKSSFEIRLGL